MAARKNQKHYERIATIYKEKARIAQLEAILIKLGHEIPSEFP